MAFEDQPIKVEFIRATPVVLQGARDPDLLVPILSISDMFVEKLLANCDRCMDRAAAYRDAFDLGCLILAPGAIPPGRDLES